jgi:non-ribosomal peptide synthetase-like protein
MNSAVDRQDAGVPGGSAGTRTPSNLLLTCPGHSGDVRWRAGERLDRLFEDRCDRLRVEGRSEALAVDAGGVTLTYAQLDERANQLARHLLASGARPGDRIALLFDQAVYSYVGMLAVLKINAAYVPLDVGFPPDRIAYILADAGVRLVLSLSHVRERVAGPEDFAAGSVCLDTAAAAIAGRDGARLTDAERGLPVEDLAYLIYTSGTTGRPKGVAIEHPSICNFVRVATEVYGLHAQDRVYQGMTIAFDFSVEEIWVPWMTGATLVPKPAGASLLGLDLHAFLTERRVTALCCVPTLLATIEDDLPGLRFLLVSGEACPQDLIARWHRPGRRFLNVYGPTEATVTGTWTTLHPDRPVTIGVPLPTYATVILDPEDPHRALPHGAVGEIGIAGIGLARGYLNRDDLTAKAFIPDFLGIAGNPSGRIYRTGDLGRVNPEGQIEYHGRIDLQVKIRGYRIELTEIESVLLQVPGIAAAVVDTYEPVPGTVELVGYYSLRTGVPAPDPETISAHLRERLPAYMVPTYLEHLPVIPMTTSDKADRKALPPPTSRHHTAPGGGHVAAATATERLLGGALATVLGIDHVSVTSHFFDDLSANSLLMAQFSALVRKQTALSLSMREIYQYPTIRSLAATIGEPVPAPEPALGLDPTVTVRGVGTPGYILCGALQLLAFLFAAFAAELVLERGFGWVSAGVGAVGILVRAVILAVASFGGLCVLPIVAKWLLVGRWKSQEIRLWSLGYTRFWLARTLIRISPIVLFAGSPLYSIYLRALGAKVGPGVVVFSRIVPVATDLVTIGAGTMIRKNSSFTGYRAVTGAIQLGTVSLGHDVLVGEQTVLDIGTSMGDRAQLGHSSSLHEGQSIPDGQSWHGSPAEPSQVDHRVVPPARCGAPRKFFFSGLQVLSALVLIAGCLLLTAVLSDAIPTLSDPAHDYLSNWAFYVVVLALSFVLFFGVVLIGLVGMATVPRLLHLLIRPGRVYPLYGIYYVAQTLIALLTNSQFFMLLLGDSSFIVYFVRSLGYDLSRVEQTGSNFGTDMRQDSPYLTTVGTGTMISDGLSIMQADFSSTSFRLSRASIGQWNFVGNNVAFPAGARTGDNTLLATKVMVPLDGPVRENVGLLGSPPFEIPRSVSHDNPLKRMDPHERRRRLAAKNRHNAATIATVLFVQWIRVFAILLLVGIGLDIYGRFKDLGLTVAIIAIPLFSVAYSLLLERAALGFGALRPQSCSIYDRYFWKHERMWKVYTRPIFVGTPFRGLLLRLAGVRIGRRVFDDGCVIPEKSLVSIGNDTVLNANSVIQCHSLEDGLFKSGYTTIGTGCTVGVGAFVHYGVAMGDGSGLAADAYLMKGEEVASRTTWLGNPAARSAPDTAWVAATPPGMESPIQARSA